MFEQSLLADGPVAKKTGAFAASFTAQILFIGVALLIPLVYQEVLPMVKLSTPLAIPVLTHPQPPKPPMDEPRSTQLVPRKPGVFYAPPHPDRDFVERPIALDAAPAFIDGPVIIATNLPPTPQLLSHVENIPPPIVKPVVQTNVTLPPTPVKLGGDVLAAKLIKRIVPVYPPIAKQARVSGTVHLEGIVAKDGTIRNLHVLSGHPLLVPAALEAVRQWVYSPTLLNGAPVEVDAPIDVNFILATN